MKKEFKIHDFVIGMKITLSGGNVITICSMYSNSKKGLGRLGDGIGYWFDPSDVQEILYDPRDKEIYGETDIKYVGTGPQNISQEASQMTTDIDIAALSPWFQISMQDGQLHKYRVSVGRDGIYKETIDGVFRKEGGTWHIPDDYIKPGIKLKSNWKKEILTIKSIEKGGYSFGDIVEDKVWYTNEPEYSSLSYAKLCLAESGPEWSWAAATKGMPIYPNIDSKDFSIEYGPVRCDAKKARETLEQGRAFHNTKCDCGAATINTTHSTWCSKK